MALTSGSNSTVLYDRCLQGSGKLDYYLKPYLGERRIRNAPKFRLSDSLRLSGNDLYVNGNLIFFKGVRLFVQSVDDAGNEPVKPELCSDVVWLKDIRPGMINRFIVPKARTILYHSMIQDEQNIQVLAHQQHFNIMEAVRLEINHELITDSMKVSCNYFSKPD
jgi:hypothetical protein